MRKHAYALLASTVLMVAPAFGQGWNVDRMSESYQTWYGTNCLAKQGNCVYLRTNYGDLSIIDVSDPADPIEVARILDGYSISDIDVAGNYAYIALAYYGGTNYGGLMILDISNPSNPTIIAHVCPPRYGKYVCVAGDVAYLVYPLQPQGSAMCILDVTDPAHPEILGQCLLPANAGEPTALDSLLYIPMQNGGLWIYDISDPLIPVQIGSISFPEGYCYGVAVSEGIAYLPLTSTGLAILDVSISTHPILLAQMTFDSWTRVVAVLGDLAYAGTDRDGFFILDVSLPSNPVILGNFTGPAPYSILSDLAAEDSCVYSAWNEHHFRITDVSDSQNPVEISSYYASWYIADVAYRDNYAYLAAAGEGFLVNDVSDPTHPWQVSYLNDLGGVYDVMLHGNYAYLYTSPGLKIVDISDPAQPFMAATYDLPGVIRKFVGNLAYAGALPDLQILDMSSPLNPMPVGFYDLPQGTIGNFDTDGSFLYANAYFEGNGSSVDSLLVLNVSNPANPQFVALNGFGCGCLVLGEGYLYVAGSDNQFRVYDVSNPAQPVEVGHLNLPMYPCDIALEDNFVYLSTQGMLNSGPRIIDVSDPSNPVLTGYYNAPAAYTQKLSVNAGYAYFTEEGCFIIYDCRRSAQRPEPHYYAADSAHPHPRLRRQLRFLSFC